MTSKNILYYRKKSRIKIVYSRGPIARLKATANIFVQLENSPIATAEMKWSYMYSANKIFLNIELLK